MRKIEPIDIMRYYVAYYDIEKKLVNAIRNGKGEEKEKACHTYINSYMGIGRNFKTNSSPMLLITVENMLKNEGNLGVEELSDRYVRNELVSRPEIKNVKVAASKLLWLYEPETIIMDNNNMHVLKAFDYPTYVHIWNEVFELKHSEIDEVINTSFRNLDNIVHERWFKMRVLDMYLLSLYDEMKNKLPVNIKSNVSINKYA